MALADLKATIAKITADRHVEAREAEEELVRTTKSRGSGPLGYFTEVDELEELSRLQRDIRSGKYSADAGARKHLDELVRAGADGQRPRWIAKTLGFVSERESRD